ncbi:enoyl-CoA hydratase/isomerase family protein [Streptomyces sp. NBC_01089]|uniref:enoyl-CoA hydratase/isomerase family protein n=1 Tax=Streptomyces sp. NBC_01089 TaxID=2903747 RepID=UPI0038700D2C|nr:enoyl-CoA hydratase/isomerase family protein [Streptomyces sp. NBC_01089]
MTAPPAPGTAGTASDPRVTTVRRSTATWIEWDNGTSNLLDLELTAAINEALLDAEADPACAVVVLAGSPTAFCGGADLAKLHRTGTSTGFAAEVIRLLKLVPALRKPVIAAVRGDALASGFSVALLADVTVAADGTRLGTVEVAGGTWPMIAQVPVLHTLPRKVALLNVVTGVPFDAGRLLDLGVIADLVAAADVDRRTTEYADLMARAGALAGTGRRALKSLSLSAGYEADLDAAYDGFVAMLSSKDGT